MEPAPPVTRTRLPPTKAPMRSMSEGNRGAAQDRFHLDGVENQLSSLPEFGNAGELDDGYAAVPGDTNQFRIFLDLALGAVAENQHVEAFGASGVFFQDLDQARPDRHHRNALDLRAQRRAVLDRHDAGDGIVGRLGRAREADDHVGLAEPADEQRLLDRRVVCVAAQDAASSLRREETGRRAEAPI